MQAFIYTAPTPGGMNETHSFEAARQRGLSWRHTHTITLPDGAQYADLTLLWRDEKGGWRDLTAGEAVAFYNRGEPYHCGARISAVE